jgi:hypothetical protein
LARVTRVVSGKPDGQVYHEPAVFTDLDLAERHVRVLEEMRPDKKGILKPFSFPHPTDFRDALKYFATQCHNTHIAIDPGGPHVRRLQIPRIIASIEEKFGT